MCNENLRRDGLKPQNRDSIRKSKCESTKITIRVRLILSSFKSMCMWGCLDLYH